jgi:hypothetical protein
MIGNTAEDDASTPNGHIHKGGEYREMVSETTIPETRPKSADMLKDEAVPSVEVNIPEQRENNVVTATEEFFFKKTRSGESESVLVKTDEISSSKESQGYAKIDKNGGDEHEHGTTAHKNNVAMVNSRDLVKLIEASTQSEPNTNNFHDIGWSQELSIDKDEETRSLESNQGLPEIDDQPMVDDPATDDAVDGNDVTVKEEGEGNGATKSYGSSIGRFDVSEPAILMPEVDKNDIIKIEAEHYIAATKPESIPADALLAAYSLSHGERPHRRSIPMISLPFMKRPSMTLKTTTEWNPLHKVPDSAITERRTVLAKQRVPFALAKVKTFVKGALLHAAAFWLGANSKYCKNQEIVDALAEVWTNKLWI